MKLVASLIVRNELGRYLEQCVASLLTFCDEVRALDDGSEDGTFEWLASAPGVAVQRSDGPPMFEHEARARNRALAWTFAGAPTHVLSIDADEFVTDGAAIRAACTEDAGRGSWMLGLGEVWKADEDYLWLRDDRKWKAQEHGVPVLWRAPAAAKAAGRWLVNDRQLACGREPMAVRALGRGLPSGSDLLHFGWTCVADRDGRYQRYVEHDGGRFHDRAHLESIMYADSLVNLRRRDWPAGLDKDALLARIRRETVPA